MSTGPEPPSWSDVLELVATLDAGGYADVDLRMSTTPRAFGDGPAVDGPAAAGPDPQPGPPPDPTPLAPPTASAGPVAVEVRAPILGTFYAGPAPDAAPFVEVGATVEADTTVAIVEVMKLMNPVAAGVAGRVVEVCATDGDLVEHGDVLFRVDPAGAS